MTTQQVLKRCEADIFLLRTTLQSVQTELLTLNPRLQQPYRATNEAMLRIIQKSLDETEPEE